MWEEMQGAVAVVSGRRIAYRRLCGVVLAWRKDDTVFAGRMPDSLPPVRGESGLEELRSEESDEDPRDFGDRCFPVAPEDRAAWLAGHREYLSALRERLTAQIEEAQKAEAVLDAERRRVDEQIEAHAALMALEGAE